MTEPGRSRSERIYASSLRIFPRSFRDRYASEMKETFAHRLEEVRAGRESSASLWLRTGFDLCIQGISERLVVPSAQTGWLRRALRSVVRRPALPVLVVGTLGVGIGTTVALFSVVRAVLLTSLPFAEPDRLVRLWETSPGVASERSGPSPLDVRDWERDTQTLDGITAWYLTSGTFRTDRWVEEIRSAQVTKNFFEVLGVSPALGSGFGEVGDRGYGPVMLSHDVWVRRFASDPSIVGKSIITSGRSYQIAGVMPPGFDYPDPSVETWIAWDLDVVYRNNPDSRSWRFLDAVARIADGESVETANADLSRMAEGLAAAYPVLNRGWGAEATSLHEHEVGAVRATLWTAFAAVTMILLIACTNVANLLLARVPERAGELRIRSALGADRGDLLGEVAAEYLVLAGLSGLLGLLVASGLVSLLLAFDAGGIPRLEEVSLNLPVLAFAFATTGLTALLFGALPAMGALRESTPTLRDGGRTTASRAHEWRVKASSQLRSPSRWCYSRVPASLNAASRRSSRWTPALMRSGWPPSGFHSIPSIGQKRSWTITRVSWPHYSPYPWGGGR